MFRNICGVLLVLFGLLGFVLPILPGIPFFFVGLAMIQHPWKTQAHDWLKERSAWYRWLALKGYNLKRKFRRESQD